MDVAAEPWGARQAVPYIIREDDVAFWVSADIDPVTQATRYLDANGQRIDMGKHGTNVAEPSKRPTEGGPDGGQPGKPDETTVTDYRTVEDK